MSIHNRRMETLENKIFTWMWKDDDGIGYDRQDLQRIEYKYGLKIKSWKCIWDKNAGTKYTYYAWITWISEDGQYGYDTVYINAYHDEERVDVENYGPFYTKEEFEKEFEKVMTDHRKFQEFMKEEKKRMEKGSEAYLAYIKSYSKDT